MVELPNHEREPTAVSRGQERFRQWFQRDINESRPYSLALAVIPLLPGMLASKAGFDELTGVLFAIGSSVAIGWLIYVFYRRFLVAARDTRRVFADHEARKRGEDPPTRCLECGFDLPEFQPPKDGKVYRFEGWNCENCGAMLDERGHVI